MAQISSREFSEWMAYYRLEPRGESRDDDRIALLTSTLVNMQRDAKKRPNPYPVSDFRLKYKSNRKPKPDELAANIDAIFYALGGTEED